MKHKEIKAEFGNFSINIIILLENMLLYHSLKHDRNA